jgi:hypothetical protein
MAYPVFPGRIRLPTERTPPRWVKRKINERAHELARRAYVAAVIAMLEEYQRGTLRVRLIDFWEQS